MAGGFETPFTIQAGAKDMLLSERRTKAVENSLERRLDVKHMQACGDIHCTGPMEPEC